MEMLLTTGDTLRALELDACHLQMLASVSMEMLQQYNLCAALFDCQLDSSSYPASELTVFT